MKSVTTLITVRASSPVLAISIFPFKNSFSLRVKHQEYLAVAGQDVDTEPLMLFTEVDFESSVFERVVAPKPSQTSSPVLLSRRRS